MKNLVLMSLMTASALSVLSGNALAAAPPLAPVNGQRSPHGSIDANGVTHVLYVANNGHIIELFPSGSQWRWDDLTNLAHAPLAATDEQVNSYARSDGLTSVIYVSQANHIIELTAGTRWVTRDVTVDAGAGTPTPNDTAPVGYLRSDGTNAIVWVPNAGSDVAIHELDWSSVSHHYVDSNISRAAGGLVPMSRQVLHPFLRGDGVTSVPFNLFPPPGNFQTAIGEMSFSGGAWHETSPWLDSLWPMGFARADNSTVMLSIGYDSAHLGHVFQQLLSGGFWGAPADMTVIASGPESDQFVSGYKRSDGLNVLVYVAFPSYHIEEIAFTGGGWHTNDLTQNGGAPAVSGGTSLFPCADGVNSVPFSTANGHIYDLFLSGGRWNSLDLTVVATPA